MIKAALWPPTREGGLHLRSDQAQIAQWRMLKQVSSVGVHVAHQHLMAIAADQFADVGELQRTGLGTQRKVHHYHYQRIFAFTESHQNRSPPSWAGQGVIFKQLWLETAEHTVAVLGKAPEVAVELLIPIGESTELGQVFDLVDVPRAQAATVSFLQRHQVEITEQVTDLLQVAGTPVVRQQVLPALGQVVPVTFGTDANLDIETEQAQPPILWQAISLQVMFVDPRIVQANASLSSPAAHGR
ncbi:hypothetical protein D3C81_838850 [compost metagenome]